MKKTSKFIFALALLLILPVTVFAYNPATLTNGINRIKVTSQEMASKYFGMGYVLEENNLGAISGTRVTADMHFMGENKMRNKVNRGLIASTTLTIMDASTIYSLASSTGFNITLPAVGLSKGVSFKFVIGAAFATADYTINTREGDNLEGSVIVAGAVVDCNAADVLTFVNDGENIGDFVEVFSDGVKWFVGQSGALTASKLTCSG